MASFGDKSTMKLTSAKALKLICLSLSLPLFSSTLLAGEISIVHYNEMVDTLQNVQTEMKKTGAVEGVCVGCVKLIEPDKKIDLNAKEIELKHLSIYKDNTPYLIHVKRTKDSPLTSSIKFKNGHTECAKMFAESSPWNPNGPLIIGCAFTMTVYEDHEIDLDLKKLPLPKDGEEQIIEIKITKPKVRNSYYSVDAQVLKGPSAKAESGKMFWGYGWNVDIVESKNGSANP